METAALSRLETKISHLPPHQQRWLMNRIARRLGDERAPQGEDERLLAAMAADPAIIRENRAIAEEFSGTEADGLDRLS